MANNLQIVVSVIALTCCGPPQKGEHGPPGPTGAAGVTGERGATGMVGGFGPTGATGEGFGVVESLLCAKSAGPQDFTYRSVLFSGGARFTFCDVADAFASHSASAFYAPGEGGASTGYCSVFYDVDTADVGYWTFTRTPLRAQYHDPESSVDLSVVTYAPGDCVVN